MELSEGTLQRLRSWLYEDPVGNSHVIYRAYFDPERAHILVDDPSNPQAVVVHHEERKRLALAARNTSGLAELLDALPLGEYHIASLDLDLIPAVEGAMRLDMEDPVWLFRMEKDDFRPTEVCKTSPVTVDHAQMVAKLWWPAGEARDYVRSRIENGLSAGIYVDGDLVAWDMSHHETDKVVMLGFLHVKEPYRGRGYAKTVTSEMCRVVFDRRKIPACQVFEDNEVSLRLTESLGFRRVRQQAWGIGTKV